LVIRLQGVMAKRNNISILAKEVVTVRIEAVQPHPRNPRQGDVAAIVESIRANGFVAPLLVQQSTAYILAGNHRWLAAREIGMAEVPVIWLDVDDDRALRILLADNRTSDVATYDDPKLASLLQEILTDTGTLEGTGFDGDALDELLASLGSNTTDAVAEDESNKIKEQYQIVVTCKDEQDQVRLLGHLNAWGYSCRALIS